MIALVAVVVMIALRLAAVAIIGSDLSFSVLFPVVIIATLIGGGLGGIATVVVGSLVALAFSVPDPMHEPIAALPRLTVWLVSSAVAVAVALQLRHTMMVLKRREAELLQTTEEIQIVAAELEHRGRNALAIVDALSRDASQHSATIEEYRSALSSRITALSAAYTFLTRKEREPMLLGSLVSEVLNAFWTRVDLVDGPMVWLVPEACVALALVVHELATNAAKYGALSVPQGRVAVSWRVVDNTRLTFLWSEHNGPRRPARRHTGFGSRMIEQAFNRIPGGSIASEWTDAGPIWRLHLAYGPREPSYAG
jgi:two-component sensor histidine kinase